MSARRSNQRRKPGDVEETTEAPTTIPPEPEPEFPVVIIIAGVCILLLIVFLVGFYCYRKKRQSGVKIGQVQPPDVEGQKARRDSIESTRYTSPNPEQRIFSIDSSAKMGSPASPGGSDIAQEEFFTKTDKARDIEMARQSLNNNQPMSSAPPEKKSRIRSFLSGRISPCLGGKKSQLEEYNPANSADAQKFAKEGYPTDAAVYNAPDIEGGGDEDVKGANTLLPPVEGKVPFHTDMDNVSGDDEEDEKTMKKGDSGFVDEAGKEARSVSPLLSKAAMGFGKPTPAPLRSSKPANPLFMAANKMQETTISTAKRTGGRRKSAGCQTSPKGSFINIPGLVESPDSSAPMYQYDSEPMERKYFIYLISDASGAIMKKDCIGRVMLPAKTDHLTLSELRDQLLKTEDESLRQMLRANKQFRFVTETYKFVAQSETVAPVDDVYPTQGIFIKFSEGAVLPDSLKAPTPQLGRRNTSRNSNMPTFLNPPTSDLVNGGLAGSIKRLSVTPMKMTRMHMTKKEKSDLETQNRFDSLRRRHVECTSPLPYKHKDAQRRHQLLCMDLRKRCDNPNCNNRPIFKCVKCSSAAYCSAQCKKDHWFEHRLVCSRPPWRL